MVRHPTASFNGQNEKGPEIFSGPFALFVSELRLQIVPLAV
jgi:hypothetical protein